MLILQSMLCKISTKQPLDTIKPRKTETGITSCARLPGVAGSRKVMVRKHVRLERILVGDRSEWFPEASKSLYLEFLLRASLSLLYCKKPRERIPCSSPRAWTCFGCFNKRIGPTWYDLLWCSSTLGLGFWRTLVSSFLTVCFMFGNVAFPPLNLYWSSCYEYLRNGSHPSFRALCWEEGNKLPSCILASPSLCLSPFRMAL